MIYLILNTFATPSAFLNDWRAFALNQIGHAGAIGFLPVMVFGAWGLLILPIYAMWEAGQMIWHDADEEDCLRDMAFVTAGALAVLFPLVLLPMIMHLAAGIARRM